MEADLELNITEADLERMQSEVDEALRVTKEEQHEAGDEGTGQTKTA